MQNRHFLIVPFCVMALFIIISLVNFIVQQLQFFITASFVIIGVIIVGSIIAIIRMIQHNKAIQAQAEYDEYVRREKDHHILNRMQLENDSVAIFHQKELQQLHERTGILILDKDNAAIARAGNVLLHPIPASVAIAQQKALEIAAPLPVAPSWQNMRTSVTENQIILGYNHEGAIYGSVEDLLSTGVVGKPKRGKTTLLMFLIAQLIVVGAQVMVLDPHRDPVLRQMARYMDYYHDRTDIEQSSATIEAMIDYRLHKIDEEHKPFLLVVDELPALVSRKISIIDAIKRVILEGRKVNMFAIVTGQSLSAGMLDGTLARNNLSSRYCFYTEDSEARMAGIKQESIDQLMPQIKTQKGICIIDAAWRSEASLAAIPLTTIDDVQDLTSNQESSKLDEVPISIRDDILRLYRDKVPRSEILPRLGKAKSLYKILKIICDNEDLKRKEDLTA